VEKLFKGAPQPAKTALRRLRCGTAYGSGHKDSLAQMIAGRNQVGLLKL
jgi:hypothetical protein